MKDYRIDPYSMDYTVEAGRFGLADDLRNNIYLSLNVRKGTWPFAPEAGSRLHLLSREKSLDRVARKAKEYCEEALKWIMDKGRAERVGVSVELDKEQMRLKCLVEAKEKGRTVTYEHFVEVR